MPLLITPSYILSDQVEFPLTTSRIGYENFGKNALWSSSGAQINYPVSALNNEMTVRRWRATTVVSWIQADYFGEQDVDYIGINAHNLSGKMLDIYFNGESAPSIEYSVGTNEAIMILFDKEDVSSLRIEITGSDFAEIGVLFFGKVLEMPMPVDYNGLSPIQLSRKTKIMPRISDSGQFLSKTIINKGYEANFSWKYLDDSWYRTYFDPFVVLALTRPFFIAWHPSSFPNEVVYGWIDEDISPSYMGVLDFFQVKFNMTAHSSIDVYADDEESSSASSSSGSSGSGS